MVKIYFDSLRDDEFEQLCTDILQYRLGKSFRYYIKGKDQGIDIKSLDEELVIFGQAKNYVNTNYSKLKSDLKNKELEKVNKINPKRYILCIGQELSRKKILELCEIMSPYLKEDDVYDATLLKKILNEKCARYILDKWDKIWISPEVVEKIYYKFKEAKYNYTKNEILEEANLFVETGAYRKANRILNKENVILIHGEPGVGKTTIARQISIKYIKEDYDLVYGNASDLKEIESNICNDKKQIILIDDFLGSNYLEKSDNIIDKALDNIIRIVKKSGNKKLILTTRTYIYNNAKAIFERFYFCSENMEKILVNVKEYTDKDKANILYNHIKYNNLLWSKEYLTLIHDKFYKDIIYHRNFNPRLISLICMRITKLDIRKIKEYILDMLENPEAIWNNEYNNLQKQDKIFLIIVALFGTERQESIVIEEYRRVLEEYNIVLDEEEIDKVIKSLSTEFITISVKNNQRFFKVSNYSIIDFILAKFSNKELSLTRYLNNIENIDLLYNCFLAFKFKNKTLCKEIVDILDTKLKVLIKNKDKSRYYVFDVICDMLKFDLTNERIEKIKVLLKLSFLYSFDEGLHLLLDILGDKKTNEELYKEALILFEEKVFKNDSNYFNIKFSDIDDINRFLEICKNFTNNKKNHPFMINILETIIDLLISYVTDEVQTSIDDMKSLLIKDLKAGKDLSGIEYDLVCEIFEDELDVLKELYTKKYYKYIVDTVIANHEAYIDEDILLEYEQEDEYNFEEYEENNDYIESLFEGKRKNMNDEKSNIFFNGVNDKELKIKLLNMYEKEEYLNYFFKTPEDSIEFVDFTNFIGKVYDDEISFYKAYKEYKFSSLTELEIAKVEEAVYNSFINSSFVLEELELFYKLQQKLIDLNIACNSEDESFIQLKNKRFHMYLAIEKIHKNKENIFNIINSDSFLDFEISEFIDIRDDILRMYSKFDIKFFNDMYINTVLDYFISENDNYKESIEQFIKILKPTISIFKKEFYIGIYGGIVDDIFMYMGLNPVSIFYEISKKQYLNIIKKANLDYTKDIKINDLYMNKEARAEFQKLGIIDKFKEQYNKLLEIKKLIEENPDVDLYHAY